MKLLVFGILLLSLWQIEAGFAEDIQSENMTKLKTMINSTFYFEDQELYEKGLNNLKDGEATIEEIEKVLGQNYAKVKRAWTTVRLFGIDLVKTLIVPIQQIYTDIDAKYGQVFLDFYDLFEMNLEIETLFLNRETYLVHDQIPASIFSEMYSKIFKYHDFWPPLKKYIEEIKEKKFNKLKEIVLRKSPLYVPTPEIDIDTNTLEYQVNPDVVGYDDSVDTYEPQFPPDYKEPDPRYDDEDHNEQTSLEALKLDDLFMHNRETVRKRNLLGVGILRIALTLIYVIIFE